MIEVRKDVLAATGGKQVPWDHSALTGEFYFQPTAAQRSATPGEAAAPAAAVTAPRSPEETGNIVALAQARERLRQLEEENQADQQKIFDKQYDEGGAESTTSRNNLSMEIGKIQMQMVRRGQEQKKLREEITALEGKLGLPAQSAEGTKK